MFVNLRISKEKKIKNVQIQPKGIYRVESNEYIYHGCIENMTYSKIFIWNEITEELIILGFEDICKMVPVKDYPKWMRT